MWKPAVIGIFCEDIRDEASGQQTLVGILPDNVVLPRLPGILPKLGIYIRVHLDPEGPRPSKLTAFLEHPKGRRVDLPAWKTETIAKGFDDAVANGVPIVGLILKVTIGQFEIDEAGIIVAKVNIDGNDYMAANLRALFDFSAASAKPALQQPSTEPQPTLI